MLVLFLYSRIDTLGEEGIEIEDPGSIILENVAAVQKVRIRRHSQEVHAGKS